MEEQLCRWVADRGIAGAEMIAPVKAGLGDTTLWRISRSGGEDDLLIRMFAAGADDAASGELIAMKAAARHGVPVPVVLLAGEMDGRPVLVTTWCPGEPATVALQRSPPDARRIGVAMGEELGRLHRVTAPDGLAPAGRWIARGGKALAPIRRRLERGPDADRLLHLDYHANNVLMADGNVSAIIDWANALPGPPHMDLARSRSIIGAIKVGGLFPAELVTALDRLAEGLAEGHASVLGPDSHPELSAAWGMAMTVDDLTGHLGKPGSWVTPAVIDRLRDERDRLVEAAMEK